jgi:RNA ligase (TIGR02306 family)
MSTLKVEVTTIGSVERHPNADRLDLAGINEWRCVIGRDSYKPGDVCVYIPIDSVLPEKLEEKLFPVDSKIKLHNHRIKTIKIRGAISQGLVVSLDSVGLSPKKYKPGDDVTTVLGVTKYEPSAPKFQSSIGRSTWRQSNPNFRKYTDIENFKNHPNVFQEGESVVCTEKIHGTNFRAGWVPYVAHTLWRKIVQKVLRLFGKEHKWEFVYGSRNVQLQDDPSKPTPDFGNVYLEMVKKYNLKNKLPKGVVIYGEIYGDGIQKGYAYGLRAGGHDVVFFDAMFDGVYQNNPDRYLEFLGLPSVPVVFRGPFSKEAVKKLSGGPSVLDFKTKAREGVVIHPEVESQHPMLGRKILKFINDEYLLKADMTDFH